MHNLEVADGARPIQWYSWLVRLAISALSLVCLAVMILSTPDRLPITTRCGGTYCEITAIGADAAAPPLRAGDRIILTEQPFATRAVLVAENVPQDRTYELRVHRGGEDLRAQLHAIGSPRADALASDLVFSFIVIFGLLMLWRGESAASQGLCLFALSLVIAAAFTVWPLAPPWNLVGLNVSALFGGPAAFMGLYITADALVHGTARPKSTRRARRAYLGALVVLYLTEEIPPLLMASANAMPLFDAIQVLTIPLAIIVWIVPLLYLVKGYRSSDSQSRLRIRWFIASITLLPPLIACNLLLQSGQLRGAGITAILSLVQVMLTVATFSILSYAVLSQRLVAVRFVMNRALVFAVLTASLIGVLSLLESLIERSVISREAGLALDLLVPLLLGVFIQRIHRWGEEGVERFVFRAEYRARHAITTFLRDAGFIAHPATLFERTVEVFAAHAGGRHAALYLAEGDSGYQRVGASKPSEGPAPRTAVDDVGMVRLRATLAPLDLYGLDSALGASGLALPLVVRGRLEGVLVCGAKAEGRYAQAEIEFLAQAASGIAACVIALRAELQGRFVSRVAAGGVPAQRIVEEARVLAHS